MMKPVSDTDQPVVAERKPSSYAHSDWCARWVTDSVKLETRPMLGRLYDATVPCSCGAEPVATLPARCLRCDHYGNLDESGICQELGTYPVQGGESRAERCGCHCVFSAESSGEPELLPDQVVAMIKESVDCEYNDLVGYKARLGAALVDLKLLLGTHVSQPDWLKDNEIKRLKDERNQLAQQGTELWQRANTAQPAGEPSDDMGRCPAIDCLHQCHWGEECSECACIGIPAGATPDGPWAAAIAALPPHKRALFTAPTCANELLARQTSQPSLTPADEVAQRAQAVLAAGEIEKLWQPQHTVDDCGACREYRKAIIAMIQKHCFTATDVEQGTCTWSLGIDAEWYTECGFALDTVRRTEAMKFCAFCGKPLVEATKENGDE